MRYNRYAMPVHPKVLENDFENTIDLNKIDEIYSFLKGKELDDVTEDTFTEIALYLKKTWFSIDLKEGINLRDREKLAPVFSEMNRIFKGRQEIKKAYRGVRLSNFDPNALTRTYPNSINDPEVLEHLEGLAYGLRSWTDSRGTAFDWALSKPKANKDRVLFEIDYPEIVLDSNPIFKYSRESFLDNGEVILYIKNPKILDIDFNYTHYIIKIKDMG